MRRRESRFRGCALRNGRSTRAGRPRRRTRLADARRRRRRWSSLPPVSAAQRPGEPIKTPRSAPACSMAVRMSVSISFSRTISPATACDTLMTVARSRCSTGVTNRAGRTRDPLFLPQVWMQLIELAHLPVGSPAQIAVPGVPQIRVGDLLENDVRRRSARASSLARPSFWTKPCSRAERMASSYRRIASSSRRSSRAISAAASAAREVKVAGQWCAQTMSRW